MLQSDNSAKSCLATAVGRSPSQTASTDGLPAIAATRSKPRRVTVAAAPDEPHIGKERSMLEQTDHSSKVTTTVETADTVPAVLSPVSRSGGRSRRLVAALAAATTVMAAAMVGWYVAGDHSANEPLENTEPNRVQSVATPETRSDGSFEQAEVDRHHRMAPLPTYDASFAEAEANRMYALAAQLRPVDLSWEAAEASRMHALGATPQTPDDSWQVAEFDRMLALAFALRPLDNSWHDAELERMLSLTP
jgi:hypothetical protein